MIFKKNKQEGFTLIELLVVISIISMLTSVVLASLNDARAKTRDAVRRSDLRQIATSLELYKSDKGNYIVKSITNGLECGRSYSAGTYGPIPFNGGWFNFMTVPTNPPRDNVDKCLFDGKYLGGIISDPSKAPYQASAYNDKGSAYMIALSNDGSDKYTIWANLEKPSTSDLTTQDNCSMSSFDNYSTSAYPVSRRMNYCVSN
jgi:prepilin-type N-terminal cleavage/methylation domain-containing protein